MLPIVPRPAGAISTGLDITFVQDLDNSGGCRELRRLDRRDEDGVPVNTLGVFLWGICWRVARGIGRRRWHPGILLPLGGAGALGAPRGAHAGQCWQAYGRRFVWASTGRALLE